VGEAPERGEGGRFLPRTPSAARSAERERLAETIKQLRGIEAQLSRLHEARERLGIRDKEFSLRAARQDLEEAKQRAPEILIARAMGEPFDPVQTVGHAEGLVEDAQRGLVEAVAADRLLADEIAVLEGRRVVAQLGRNDAITAVLHASPELAALRDRIEQTRQQLYAFSWICSAIGQQRLPRGLWDGVLWGSNGGHGEPWKAALMALEHDADAELPGA
jgi:hypothetical protein